MNFQPLLPKSDDLTLELISIAKMTTIVPKKNCFKVFNCKSVFRLCYVNSPGNFSFVWLELRSLDITGKATTIIFVVIIFYSKLIWSYGICYWSKFGAKVLEKAIAQKKKKTWDQTFRLMHLRWNYHFLIFNF